MTRRWSYAEPGDGDEPRIVTMTEAEILAEYFPSWSKRMRAIGKADQITREACLEDWIVVNWAHEVIEP